MFRPEEEQDPAIKPPLWSLLVYMLLLETLGIDDETIKLQLGLVSFPRDRRQPEGVYAQEGSKPRKRPTKVKLTRVH